MTSFLSSPAQFRLLGFSAATEDYVDSHRGIITVRSHDSKEPQDPILDKLNAVPRFVPLLPLPHQTKTTRSLWGSTPIITPQLEPEKLASPFIESEERVSKAIYDFLALNHQRIYHEAREITRAQAQLSSGIKRLEATATATNTKASQYQKDLRVKKERLMTCMALMHQEVAKTRFHLQGAFGSLRRTREALDLLLLREGISEQDNLTMDAQSYPNLYQLTFRHRSIRPRSYHPHFQHRQNETDDVRPRCSLDLPQVGRSWSISRAGALRHLSGASLPTRDRGSVTSLPEPIDAETIGPETSTNSSASSLIASATSRVQFANSKAYRQLSPNEGSPPPSNAEEQTKRKSLSLRSTISLASLRTLRKIIPPQATPANTVKAKPLNAKDRLHQIAASSPESTHSHTHFSKWFPSMFRGTEPPLPSSKSNSISRRSKTSKPPTLPALESIDYRIVLTTTNEDGTSFDPDFPQEKYSPLIGMPPGSSATLPIGSYPNRGRLPSFTSLLEGSALSGSSPLQNEIG